MKNLITNRFEPERIFEQSRQKATFFGKDHFLQSSGVVVKLLRRGSFPKDPAALARFFRWHRGVQHPNLAQIFDVGLTHNHDLYCVREFLHAESSKLSNTEYARQLVSAVAILHTGNQIHGSIRPSNVFVSDGVLKLADPRISHVRTDTFTEDDIRFIAPEIPVSGSHMTFQSDLYSLGAVLYRLFSGRDPFDDFDLQSLKSKYNWACPQPLNSICYVSNSVSDLVGALLEKNPEKRPTLSSVQLVFPGAACSTRAPQIGREREMESVQRFFYGSPRAHGLKIVFLEGSAGIGKTRFLEEVAAEGHFQEEELSIVRCTISETDTFRSFLQCLNELLRKRVLQAGYSHSYQLGSYESNLSQYFTADIAAPDATYPTDRVISDIVGLLRSLAETMRITIGIEDINEASDSVLRILEQLCLRAPELQLRLILTRRFTHKPFKLTRLLTECIRENLLLVCLNPLDESESDRLLRYFAVAPEQKDCILKASSGKPFFLYEYAKKNNVDGTTHALDELFLSITDTLTRAAASLAETISLFPTGVHLEVLGVLSPTVIDESLQELCSVDLVAVQEENISFKNADFRLRMRSRMSTTRRVKLHRSSYSILQQRQSDPEMLAHHSFYGRLHEQAAGHCLELANDSSKLGNYSTAATFYVRAEICLRALGRKLEPDAQADLAFCYARIGKISRANEIYRELHSSGAKSRHHLGVMSLISAGAVGPECQKPISDGMKLCIQAIKTSAEDSPMLSTLYASLSQLFIQSGELVNAKKALSLAKESLNKNWNTDSDVLVHAAEGYLLLHSGKFHEALSILKSIKTEKPSTSAMLSNNIALCFEHLGDLKSSMAFEMKCQSSSEISGFVLGRILCLMNMGTFRTKLGNFSEAAGFFSAAGNLISTLRARDKTFRLPLNWVLYVDCAQLQLQLGQYAQARETLRHVGKPQRVGLEGGQFILTQCELYLCFGDTAAITQLIKTLDRYEVCRTEFFSVERVLIVSRLEDIALERRANILLEALEVATRLRTKYQVCRILIELGIVLLELNRHSEARKRALAALRIARAQDYKPLAAKALLTLAKTCANPLEKEAALLRAFHAASDLGMPELKAESAFFIGSHQYANGQYGTAEEYLMRSTSVTRDLLDGVPQPLRKKYLSRPWRNEATVLLRDCRNKTQSVGSLFAERSATQFRNDFYFRALYRLTLSSTAVTTPEAFTMALVQTLETIKRPLVVMVRNENKLAYHPVRTKLSDDLCDRVRSLSEKSQNRIYFGSSERTQHKDTVAWVPLRSEGLTGGIYVSCRQGESLAEDELEFLTIVGTIANTAMDRLARRDVHSSTSEQPTYFPGIVGDSKAMRQVYTHIKAASQSPVTVLIEGESGTGKEVVAKAIHQASPRAKQPFVAVDCGAIPEGLIEAELFGVRKGSYTGATADRIGLFEAANDGTLFMDEISNMSQGAQAKLLRVLQEREVRRIGDIRGRPIDVRLIAATNSNLERLVSEGRFRQDLLYRLNVFRVKLPALRTRREDIPLLAQVSLARLNSIHKAKKRFDGDVLKDLQKYSFPGNVRELQNAIERAFFLARGNVITEIPLEQHGEQIGSTDEVQAWFKELIDGRQDFWTAVHNRYKRRDISREKVIALVDLGLKSTKGSYKNLAGTFRLKEKEYRRFMDFLRRNECLLDFRPYRKAASGAP